MGRRLNLRGITSGILKLRRQAMGSGSFVHSIASLQALLLELRTAAFAGHGRPIYGTLKPLGPMLMSCIARRCYRLGCHGKVISFPASLRLMPRVVRSPSKRRYVEIHRVIPCLMIVGLQYVLDGQEGMLTHKFILNIAPVSAINTSFSSQSRRPSISADIAGARRTQSDSVLPQGAQRYVVIQ